MVIQYIKMKKRGCTKNTEVPNTGMVSEVIVTRGYYNLHAKLPLFVGASVKHGDNDSVQLQPPLMSAASTEPVNDRTWSWYITFPNITPPIISHNTNNIGEGRPN